MKTAGLPSSSFAFDLVLTIAWVCLVAGDDGGGDDGGHGDRRLLRRVAGDAALPPALRGFPSRGPF